MAHALGDDRAYHEFVFLLQGAAFIALATQGYGFTLDVKTRSGLRAMKIISAFTVLVLLYSRGGRYVIVAAQLLRTIDAGGSVPLWYVGANAVGLMGLLNLAMTGEAAAKFVKFAQMSHDDAGVVELHRQLSGSLFAPETTVNAGAGGADATFDARSQLFQHIIAYFPDELVEPRGDLVDLVDPLKGALR